MKILPILLISIVSFLIMLAVIYVVMNGLKNPLARDVREAKETVTEETEETVEVSAGDSTASIDEGGINVGQQTEKLRDEIDKFREEIDRLSSEIKAKKNGIQLLEVRLEAVEEFQEEIDRLSSQIEGKSEQIQLLEAQLAELRTERDSEKEKEIKQMAKIIGSMSTEAVDSIASNLDDDFLIGIISRCKEREAVKIMAAIEPKRAARIAQKMAGTK